MTSGDIMGKEIDKIIKRLMHISYEINREFEELAELSYHDGEETEKFNDHIEYLKSLFNSEAVIINNLDLTVLKEIYQLLPAYDDETVAFDRTSICIEDKILELSHKEGNYECLEEINDEEDLCENLELPNDDEQEIIEKYYLEDEENERYEEAFIDYISIKTLKNIRDRIDSTKADNKNDAKYKKRLLKNLKTFKYLVLAQNRHLEKLGVHYRFNISKMPYLECPDIDVSIISYNHCILLLSKLYNPLDEDDELDNTAINLFNMMSFETYLNNVDKENLEKLLMLCNELTEKAKNPYYGNIAKAKILNKTKN